MRKGTGFIKENRSVKDDKLIDKLNAKMTDDNISSIDSNLLELRT